MTNKPKEAGYTTDTDSFHFRACAIIIEDGKILVAHNDREPYFYSVGGGVHLQETIEQAVIREVFEETGIKYEIDRLAFVHENFFKMDYTFGTDGRNKLCHEVAFYFIMKPNGTKVFNHESLANNGAKEKVCWLEIDKLHEYKVFPVFFTKEKLLNLSGGVEHIVHRDENL